MPESKKNVDQPSEKVPADRSVDWAERLKASMEKTPDERPASVPAAEEDDLAVLLRAQLARQNQPAEAPAPDLDTSDFEEEDEEPEESEEWAEAEEETATEAKDLPETEDDADDLPWDEDDEPTDPLPEPDMVTVYTADDGEEVPAKAPVASEDADDLPWDEDDEPAYPLPELDTVTVYTPDEEEDATAAAPMEPEPVWTVSRGFTIEPVPYDEEEGLSPDGEVGDVRLLEADEESTRLLAEEGLSPAADVYDDRIEEDLPAENRPSDGNAPPAEDGVSDGQASVRNETPPQKPRPQPLSDDPLQLSLDDIRPAAEHRSPAKTAADRSSDGAADRAADYTTRMTLDSREETVRSAELYLRLGYEEQMTRSEQQEAVEEVRRRALEREATAPRNETASVKVRREYTSRKQTPAIERSYSRTRRLHLTRLCVAAVGALFGILHDYLGVLLMSADTLTYADSVLYPLIGTLWTVLICLPFLSRLGRGLKSLIDFEPTRYAVSAIAIPVSVIHGILALFVRRPYLYGGVALLMLTVAAASEYINTVAEHRAFSVVSSGKTSFVLTDETTPASATNAERDPDERTLTAVRTGRLSDYFARTGRYNPYMGRLNYLLPVALLAAILCAGMAILRGGSLLYQGIPVFTATFFACLPAAYVTAMSLPLCRANGILRKKGTAVVGAAAPADYTGKGSARLLIRDGDALGGLYRKEITLRDDPNVALWRGKANRLFRLLECPLWNESPLGDDDVEGLSVEVAESEEGYVRLYLIDRNRGETTEIMMGNREALARRGIRLPKASMERVYKKTEESQVVYLAFDRTFRIAYAVEYRVGRTFARAVEKLASMGDTAALVTYDPLVSAKLLELDRFKSCPKVELIRPAYVETVRASRSGGVIATGRSLDLLYPYAACRRIRKVYRLSHLVSWLSILAAMGLSLVTVFTGSSAVLSAAAVTAWQILLTAVSVAISLLTVTRRSLFVASDAPKDPPVETPAPTAPAEHTKPQNQKR